MCGRCRWVAATLRLWNCRNLKGREGQRRISNHKLDRPRAVREAAKAIARCEPRDTANREGADEGDRPWCGCAILPHSGPCRLKMWPHRVDQTARGLERAECSGRGLKLMVRRPRILRSEIPDCARSSRRPAVLPHPRMRLLSGTRYISRSPTGSERSCAARLPLHRRWARHSTSHVNCRVASSTWRAETWHLDRRWLAVDPDTMWGPRHVMGLPESIGYRQRRNSRWLKWRDRRNHHPSTTRRRRIWLFCRRTGCK
ncbi:hypothetical protein K461DRAFT_110854 [Myriangium duriaei CBS 260.36]|uniref:Uncharacterized protein n=1 Tax=Myriangium duriaei CBS 260.36 TaxID=1168546 RepID=A0A9P4J5Z9_9PEZI|nr:hypothetical protein K461DRAFT_110854 [Myriangium duriaei CBS 260.36]